MCKSKLNSLPDLCKSKLYSLPDMCKSKLHLLPDLCKSNTPSTQVPSFQVFWCSFQSPPTFHFQSSFQSHITWVQSHLMCPPPWKNNIFHLAWKNSQKSRSNPVSINKVPLRVTNKTAWFTAEFKISSSPFLLFKNLWNWQNF